MKELLRISNVSFRYGDNIVLKNISFSVYENEVVSVLGESGCGKTTLLKIVNGLLKPDEGKVFFNGVDITELDAYQREQINTVFQDYALFPHFTVRGNISYGIEDSDYADEAVPEYLRIMGIEGVADLYPDKISGGQRQRTALARVIIKNPYLLLLDEPFAALDPHLRERMREEIRKLRERIRSSFLLITHDQEDAFSLSDRVIIINDGLIQQIGTPTEIYEEPDNRWVAEFIGKSNIISDGIFIKDEWVRFDEKNFKCVDKGFGENESSIDIVIRPEDVIISRFLANGKSKKRRAVSDNNKISTSDSLRNNAVTGYVIECSFRGIHWDIKVKSARRIFHVQSTRYIKPNTRVTLRWDPASIHVMWK